MKIAVISNAAPKTNKSPLTSLCKLLEILPIEADVSFYSIDYSLNDFSNIDRKVEYHILSRKTKSFLNYKEKQKKLIKILIKEGADIALFWLADKMLFMLNECKKHKIKTVFWIYGNVNNKGTLKGVIADFLKKQMIYSADYIAVESPSVIEQYSYKIRRRCKKIITLPIFSNNNEFKNIINYQNRQNNILVVSRISPEKNINNIIDAFYRFNIEHEKKWNLIIIGDGPDKEKICTKIALLENIRFLGWQNHDIICRQLNNSKLFIIASSAEGLPSTLQEAMLCGTPVLATKISGMKDIIVDNYNGWFLKGITANDIYNGLTIFDSFSNKNEISMNAIETIKKNYSKNECKLKMYNFICNSLNIK